LPFFQAYGRLSTKTLLGATKTRLGQKPAATVKKQQQKSTATEINSNTNRNQQQQQINSSRINSNRNQQQQKTTTDISSNRNAQQQKSKATEINSNRNPQQQIPLSFDVCVCFPYDCMIQLAVSVAILAAVVVFLALPIRGNEIGVAWQLGHLGSRETCFSRCCCQLAKVF
jgi:hypothetical protein